MAQGNAASKYHDIGHEHSGSCVVSLPTLKTQTTIKIEGMSCGHCSNAVQQLINGLPGVRSAAVDLGKKEALVEFDRSATSETDIIANINNSNTYKATPK